MSHTEDDMCPPLRSGKINGSSANRHVAPPDLVEQFRRYNRINTPHSSDPRMRVLGFVVHEDVAGLSEGLFLLDKLVGPLVWPDSESDGSPKGQDRNGLGLQDDSAVPAGHSPPLLPPGDVEKVIERLTIRADYHDNGGVAELQFLDDGNLYREAIACIRSLTTSTEENKRLRAERDKLAFEKISTAIDGVLQEESEIEKLRAENDVGLAEAMDRSLAFVKDRLADIKAAKGLVGLYCDAFRAGWFSRDRASQSQAEAMRRALEEKDALIKYLEASNQGILEHLTKQTKYLNGKISRLREVVEPFAQAADEYDRTSSGEPVHGILVPVQDCYAARTALSIKGGEK